MYTPSWLRTVLASAAVAVPFSASAADLPPARHQKAWSIARPPALPEFGFSPGPARPLAGDDQSGRLYRIDIPAGTLGDAADRLAAVTGLRVRFADAGLRTLPSPRVTGSYTAAQALGLLLEGTGVGYRFTAPDAVTLDIRTSQEVTVSGTAVPLSSPKFTEPLRDTPHTVAVIPSIVIEEQSATSLRDALRNTPGITLTAGEGGTAPGDNFLIRGFSARNDVYVDGARDPGVSTRDTFNTEALEVTKGPSSSITGRGATGGSINVVTKSPTLQNTFASTLQGGSAESGRITADVNRRLGGHHGARLNVMWQDQGVPRRDDVRNRSWGLAPSVAFGLGTPTDVTIGYQHLQQDNVPDYGLPATLPQQAVDRGITIDDLDFSNFYGLLSRDYEQTRSDLGTVTLRHQFDPRISLRNLTRYGRNELDRVVTPPRAATSAASTADPGFDATQPQMRRTDTKYQFRTDETLVNQTDLTLRIETGRLGHAIRTGAEVSRDRQPSYALTDAFSNGRPPVTDLFHPDDTQPYSPALVKTGASTDGTSHGVAGYLFDTIRIGPQWQADLGMRWDRVTVDYDNVAATGVRTALSRRDAAPSGHAGVVFKPSPAGSLYASYSTSFNPSFDGSFGLTLTAATAPLPPEKTHNLEGGVKWEVRRALLTAAIFNNEKINAKTTDESGATVLAGNQSVRGVELSLSGDLTDRWSVLAGLALMKGTINESGVAAEEGRRLSYVPRKSFNAWSTYRMPEMRLTLGGGAQFTDGYFFNNTNALTTANLAAIQRLTRYWLFSAMASYEINPHVRLQVNGTNLADARYVDRGYTGHFIPGPGRGIALGPAFTF